MLLCRPVRSHQRTRHNLRADTALVLRTAIASPVWRGGTCCFCMRYRSKNPGVISETKHLELAGEHDYQRQQDNNEVGDGLHTLAHTLYDLGIIGIDTGVHTRQTKCHAKELHGY